MKKALMFFCMMCFTLGAVGQANADLTTLSNNPLDYEDYDKYFDVLSTEIDTRTIGGIDVTLYCQVSKTNDDGATLLGETVYGYVYQVEFSADPEPFGLDLFFSVAFNSPPSPFGGVTSWWGQGAWPLPGDNAANTPLSATYGTDIGGFDLVFWDLKEDLVPTGGFYRTAPMIVLSTGLPEKNQAGLFNGANINNQIDGAFWAISAGAPVPEPVTIGDIITFFDDKVAEDELVGCGRSPWVAELKLNKMRKRLLVIECFIQKGLTEDALQMAKRAYKRCDGERWRKHWRNRWRKTDYIKDSDWTSGATEELAGMIEELIESLEMMVDAEDDAKIEDDK